MNLLLRIAILVTLPIEGALAQTASTAPATTRRAAAVPQPLRVRTGITAEAGQIVPLKLYDLELSSASDTARRFQLQTDLDGAAEIKVPPGDYLLRSLKPTTISGRTYRWEMPVKVAVGKPTTVQVTSANAIARGARPKQPFASSTDLYLAVQSSIVRVNAGLGHGTGFLVDGQPGLIITNDHVIGTSKEVIINVDTVTSVFAHVVTRDKDADLAILRMNESVCGECMGLRLARAGTNEVLVRAGEPLVAIGFPLNQRRSISNGIASNVRDGAIISDVNVNPGNSGGPMLNMFGDVVGVNTFVDAGRVGAGVSGAVDVAKLLNLLERAKKDIVAASVPSAERLPVLPQARYTVGLLRSIADTGKPINYQRYQKVSAQNFTVTISTPVAFYVRSHADELDVSSGRRQRELRAGVQSSEGYSDLSELRDWREFVGEETAPVVSFRIEPKDGLEGEGLDKAAKAVGRIFKRGESARREFKGDVAGVSFTRNGRLVRYVQGGHAPQRVEKEGLIDLKDVADFGYYTLLPDVFEPDTAGVPPVIGLEIADLKNPNLPRSLTLSPDVVAQIWNDFVPYLREQDPKRKVVVAVAPGLVTPPKKKE